MKNADSTPKVRRFLAAAAKLGQNAAQEARLGHVEAARASARLAVHTFNMAE